MVHSLLFLVKVELIGELSELENLERITQSFMIPMA